MVFGDLGTICVGFVFSLLLFIREVWTTKNADRMPPEKEGLWGLERRSHLKAGVSTDAASLDSITPSGLAARVYCDEG